MPQWYGQEVDYVRPWAQEWREPDRLQVLYRSLRKALEDGKNESGAGGLLLRGDGGSSESTRKRSTLVPEHLTATARARLGH